MNQNLISALTQMHTYQIEIENTRKLACASIYKVYMNVSIEHTIK